MSEELGQNVTVGEVVAGLRKAKRKLGDVEGTAGIRAAMAAAIRFIMKKAGQAPPPDRGPALGAFEHWKRQQVDPAWTGFLCYVEIMKFLQARGWISDQAGSWWWHPEHRGFSGDMRAALARETAAVKQAAV